MKKRKPRSPFKPFEAFENNTLDNQFLFGRDEESAAIKSLYSRSPLIIVVGPSGSGKSSIIRSKLYYELGIKDAHILKFRYKADVTFEEQLIDHIASWQVDHLYEEVGNLYDFSKESRVVSAIDHFQKIIKILNEESKTKFDSEKILELRNLSKVLEQKIFKYRKKTSQVYIAIKEQLELELKAHKTELSRISKTHEIGNEQLNELMQMLKTVFSERIRSSKQDVVFEFDQFEDYFKSSGNQLKKEGEVKLIGKVLKLLTENDFSLNTILCIREDYFSKIDSLQEYFNKIYSQKVFIEKPNFNTAITVIKESFKEVKITINNSNFLDNDPYSLILNRSQYSNDSDLHEFDRIDFPFLQVYLDKLYSNALNKPFDPENIEPVEIRYEDIVNTGGIESIIQQILVNIDNELVTNLNFKNKIFKKEINNEKQLSLKLLKLFVEADNTKKSVSLDPKSLINGDYHIQLEYNQIGLISQNFLVNKFTDKQFKQDKDLLVNFIISRLYDERLLRLNAQEGIIELSHDKLAEIINDQVVPDDLIVVYKKQFKNSFDEYISKKKNNSALLSAKKVKNFLPYFNTDFISSFNKEDSNEKLKYWQKSKKKRHIINFLKAAVCLILLIGVYCGNSHLASQKAKANEDKWRVAAQKDSINFSSFQDRTEIENLLESDITKAYKLIDSLKKDTLKEERGLAYNEHLVSKFKQIILNYSQFPGYKFSQKIDSTLGTLRHIKSRYNNVDSTLFLVALFEEDLAISKIKLTDQLDTIQWVKIKKQISCFEPFLVDNKFMIAVGNNSKIDFVDENLKDLGNSYNLPGAKSILDLDFINDSQIAIFDEIGNIHFITKKKNSWSKLTETLVLKDTLYQASKNNGALNILTHENQFLVCKAKGVHEGKLSNYLGGVYVYNTKVKKGKYNLFDFPDFVISRAVYSISIKDQKLFVVLQNYILVYEIKEDGNLKLDTYSMLINKKKGRVSSFDIIDSYYLIGDENHSISLYRYYKLPNQDGYKGYFSQLNADLIGHKSGIQNVSFINEDEKQWIITIDDNAELKIWNVKDYYIAKVKIPKAKNITRLIFSANTLYSGYLVDTVHKDHNVFFSIDKNLDISSSRFLKPSKDHHYVKNSNITGIDNSQQEIIVSNKFNKLVMPLNGAKANWYINAGSTIYDIAGRSIDDFVVIASANGVCLGNKSSYDCIIKKDKNIVTNVDIHPNLDIAAFGKNNGSVKLWNFSQDKIKELTNHGREITGVRFSETGEYIATVSWDRKLKLFKQKSQFENLSYTMVDSLEDHGARAEDVEFFEDNHLATCSRDRTVKVYKIENDKLFLDNSFIIENDHGLQSVTFGNDSTIIYTGDVYGTIKKWDKNVLENQIDSRIQKIEQ